MAETNGSATQNSNAVLHTTGYITHEGTEEEAITEAILNVVNVVSVPT